MLCLLLSYWPLEPIRTLIAAASTGPCLECHRCVLCAADLYQPSTIAYRPATPWVSVAVAVVDGHADHARENEDPDDD